MRLLHAWGNRSSFPTTSREPPIAPWLFGGLLSDERNKMIGTTSLRKGVELQLWDRQDLEQWAFQFKLGLRKSSCRCGSTTCESPIEASWQHPIILFAVSMNASPSWRTSCLGDGNWSVLPFQSSHSQTMREVTCFFYLQLLLCLSLLLCQAWKCEKDVASSMHQQGDITHIHLSAEFQLAMAIMDHSGSLWIIVTISPLLTVYDRKCQVLSASKVPNLCFNLQEEAVQSPMAEVSQLLSLVGNMTALTTLEDEARSLQGLYRIRPWRFFFVLKFEQNKKTARIKQVEKPQSTLESKDLSLWIPGSRCSCCFQVDVQLDDFMVNQLQSIAKEHGGKVPIHGRLFAQWLHYVFPRDSWHGAVAKVLLRQVWNLLWGQHLYVASIFFSCKISRWQFILCHRLFWYTGCCR